VFLIRFEQMTKMPLAKHDDVVATVGRYMPWRPKVPSPTWRSFLQNHTTEMVEVDMFVVATTTFRLLFAVNRWRSERPR
jgi:hypothetical protein